MENNNDNLEPNLSDEESVEELAVSDALIGVITSPGETFETIAVNKRKNYWLLSVIVSIVIGIVITFIFFKDEQLINGLMDKQRDQLEKQMEEKVKEGKMSPEQSNQAIEQAEKFMDPKSLFFQVIGYGGATLVPLLMLFVLSLVYLLLLKMFKAEIDFGNIMNVVGLPMIITVIGAIVGLVLSVLLGKMSSLSPALLYSEGKLGDFLLKFDLFTAWYYAAVSIGLSKLAKIPSGKAYGMVFGVWLLWILFTGALGLIF